ncbi:MAG: pseudouridine synthase [Verrucomicrobiota bacterium]
MSKRVRLQKFISQAGICSRRKAEDLIREGRVSVDDKAAELGQTVDPEKERVFIDQKPVVMEEKPHLTLILNKPRHYVCTHSDPHQDETVFDLLPKQWRDPRLVCAGRLDKDSEGLLVLSTDGELVQRLTHPSRRIVKRYLVKVQRDLEAADVPKLLRGRTIEGQWLQFDKLVPPKGLRTEFEVHLDHGKKREIRRLLESFGYLVKRLKRTQVGGLKMRGLARGQARPLRSPEIKAMLSEKYRKEE